METLPKILLYGAYGFTGKLIAAEAQAQQIPLLLLGRREAPLRALSEATGHPYRVADLTDLPRWLSDADVVIHAAGPFSETAAPMVRACLDTGTHYLDITGEWMVFEALAAQDQAAKAANIMLLPGCGFDVVPSDCLARYLHEQLPDARQLELAIMMQGGLSHGTAVTALTHIKGGSRARVDGQLVAEPLAARSRRIPFSRGEKEAISIPWGDVVTAWHSTGIPNIRVLAAQPPAVIRQMKWMGRLSGLIGWGPVNRFLRRQLDRRLDGPDAQARARGRAEVWGEVRNAAGEVVTARVTGPDGYGLTAQTSLHIARRVQQGDWQPGFQTPATAYGADLILEACRGTERQLLTRSD